MRTSAELVGDLVAEMIMEKLRSGGPGSMLRVSNLIPPEISEVARRVRGFSFGGRNEPLAVVIGAWEAWPGLPEDLHSLLLPRDRTATSYRNDTNLSGFVFLEDQTFSDAQSLRDLVCIDDSSVLGSEGDAGTEQRHELIRRAWDSDYTGARPLPDSALEAFDTVWELRARENRPPLRQWVEFVLACCMAMGQQRIELDLDGVFGVLGSHLHLLNLFKDSRLGDHTSRERSRRLDTNEQVATQKDPKGRLIDKDDLLELSAKIEFTDATGTLMPRRVQEDLRRHIRTILFPCGRPALDLELDIWLQLFRQATTQAGLGTRIADHLTPDEQDTAKYSESGVQDDLDKGDTEAAQRFIERYPYLIEKLPRELARPLERLAEPRSESIDDPLRFLIAELNGIASDAADAAANLHLGLRRLRKRSHGDAHSRELFAFLFGPTLSSVFGDAGASRRIRFDLDPELVRPAPVTLVTERDPDSEEGGDTDEGWSPLQMELYWVDNSARPRRFEWRPLEHQGLIAFRRQLEYPGIHHWSGIRSFEDWCQHALEPAGLQVEGKQICAPEGGPTSQWLRIRAAVFARILETGLDPGEIRLYLEAWTKLLQEVRSDCAPAKSPHPELAAFLAVDTVLCNDDRAVISAAHPLRLRWIEQHLTRTRQLLERVTEEGLLLNPVNDSLYFRRLGQLSPHEHPPLVTLGDNLYVAVKETDWHEHFAVLKRTDATDTSWLGELDDSSVDEMSRVVGDYVDAHPHKADGVSLLLLIRSGGQSMAARLVARVLRDKRRPSRILLHVFTPVSEYGDLEAALAQFDNASERGISPFPPLTVVFHDWPEHRLLPNLQGFAERVDLAFVPNLFGAETRAMERTTSMPEGSGSFDVWLDAPSHIETEGSAGSPSVNVARVLLPRSLDDLLYQWSTINVWAFRHEPVQSPVTESTVDFMSLNVRFDRGQDLYSNLHDHAQWVVTLDAFVGRDQIESLKGRPDVILVRPRIGKGQAYTLVVSSSRQREFLIARLDARLQSDLPESVRPKAKSIAEEIYNGSRLVSPGIVLRALGVGWAAQELVGLDVARRIAQRRFRTPDAEGFRAWLSLDEHLEWFGSAKPPRADLLRIGFHRGADGVMSLDLLVIEAKFRDDIGLTHADKQISNTLDWIGAAMQPVGGSTGSDQGSREPDDCSFWRRAILSAIEQLPRGGAAGICAFEAFDHDGRPMSSVPPVVREEWLDGKYRVERAQGVFVSVSPSGVQPSAEDLTPDGHHWCSVDPQLLADILGEPAPTPLQAAPEAERGYEGPVTSMPEPEVSRYRFTLDGKAESQTKEEPAPNLISKPVSAPTSTRDPGLPERPVSQEGEERARNKYRKLLKILKQYQANVYEPSSEPWREGPAYYVFRVRPDTATRPDQIRRLLQEIKLGLELPAESNPRIYVDRGCVVLEVPKPEEERYPVGAESLWARTSFDSSRLYAPIGEDVRGGIVGIDFSSSDTPHLLVAGTTGSGKSVAMETILVGLAKHHPPSRLRLAIVDPKETEFTVFKDAPHLLGRIGCSPDEAKEILEHSVAVMEERRSLFKEVDARNLPEYNQIVPEGQVLPWHVIVLDEYGTLAADKADRKEIEGHLKRLSQKARASGIHLIVATQYPTVEVINNVVRANLPAKLALRLTKATESNVVLDESGAETLAGRGDAFFKTGKGMLRIQCARITS